MPAPCPDEGAVFAVHRVSVELLTVPHAILNGGDDQFLRPGPAWLARARRRQCGWFTRVGRLPAPRRKDGQFRIQARSRYGGRPPAEESLTGFDERAGFDQACHEGVVAE